MATTKQFFLFTERGETERFFCGNIYEAFPDDEIKVDGELISFSFAAEIGRCKSFTSRKEANQFASGEMEAMEDSNNYANRAMASEEKYGMDGVDDCSGDY